MLEQKEAELQGMLESHVTSGSATKLLQSRVALHEVTVKEKDTQIQVRLTLKEKDTLIHTRLWEKVSSRACLEACVNCACVGRVPCDEL